MQVLMCSAKYFDVKYDINAWMHQHEAVDKGKANEEWQNLYNIYTKTLGWNVKLIDPVEGLPDMVFTTDNAVIVGNKVMLAKFRYPERQPEPAHFESWLKRNGFSQIAHPKNVYEGGGDTLKFGNKFLIGYGFRSALESHAEVAEYFNKDVVSLRLVDPYFYHLDTAVAVLNDQTVAYYPEALDTKSQKRLKAIVPNLIEATLAEAQGFALNLFSDGKNIITSNKAPTLLEKYRQAGFSVYPTSILEFRKSGGGVKCLTLELN